MPVQTFRWIDGSVPTGETANIFFHGLCGPSPDPAFAFLGVPTEVVRSWRRRVPRSTSILVDVEVAALVPIFDEDLPWSVGTPPSHKAKSAPAPQSVVPRTCWARILEVE